MNVQEALIGVITMQIATTLQGVTTALARLDTQGMGYLATVSSSIFQSQQLLLTSLIFSIYNIQTLMSASTTMEVATTLAMTWKEVTHVHAVMDTCLIVMNKHVKVRIYWPSDIQTYKTNVLYLKCK